MEYERFLYLHPSHPGAPGVLFNLATSAKLAGDGKAAVTQYNRFLSRYPQHELAGEVRSMLAKMNAHAAELRGIKIFKKSPPP